MAATYTSFGNHLLLKQRTQDALGSLWRVGEMERLGFKRIGWLRRFDQTGLDRTALAAEAGLVNQLAQTFKASNVARNAVFGTEGGIPYLVWDYVPAQPLDQLLVRIAEEQFPVAIDNALLIAEKLSAALSAALALEVGGEPLVHGFLIPQLIMIGNDGEAVVSGFGLTRGLLANLDRVAVHEMAAPFLAPEVLSSGAASKRADVYSMGAILYRLLCGAPLPVNPAERGAALANLMLAFDEGPVPDDVAAILRKALSPRPEDRYGSAADFKRELEKLLYGGAYSPTTFNLALFMDRLYRHEIEEEDRELQHEKSLDVTAFYRAPGEAGPAETPPPPAANKTVLYAALAGLVVLLGVIGFLIFGRSGGQGGMSADEVKAMIAKEMQGYAQRETELNKQLQDSQTALTELKKQLTEPTAAPGKKALTAGELAKQEEDRKALAAKIAEQEAATQRQREELARVQKQKEEAAQRIAAAASRQPMPTAAPQPTAVPVRPTVPPPAAAVVPTTAPAAAAPVVIPTAAPQVAPTALPVVAPSLAAATKEGDLVDFTQVDMAPQTLMDVKPTIPRAAMMQKRNASGVVIVGVLVNEKGGVEDVKLLRGYPVQKLGIDEACLEAARQYRFKPAMKDNVKVKTWVTVTMPVVLPGR